MSKSSYKVLSTKYHNSERCEKTSKTCSSDQSKSNLFGDQTHLRIPYRFPLDSTIPNHWLDKVAKCDWRQENFICVKTPLGDRDDFRVIQLYLNQDYSLSVEALVQQFPKATGLYYYNTDNSLCGVPQNQAKLFPPSSGNQTFYFTELGCNCSAWVQDIKAQISQISHFKSQVERLEEEIEVSRANYNNSVSQLKKEIEDMRLEMKQLKESNMEDVCMLKQELKKNKLKGNTEPNFNDAVSRGGDSDFFDGPWDVGDGDDSDQDEGSVAGLVRPTSGNVASSQTSSEEGHHCLGCGGARDYGSLPDYQQMTQDSGGIDDRVNRGTAAKLPKSKRRSPAAKAKGVSRLLEFQARLSCEKGLPPSRMQMAQESKVTHISVSPPILPGSSMSTCQKNLLADLDGLETSCPSFGGQNVVISREENEKFRRNEKKNCVDRSNSVFRRDGGDRRDWGERRDYGFYGEKRREGDECGEDQRSYGGSQKRNREKDMESSGGRYLGVGQGRKGKGDWGKDIGYDEMRHLGGLCGRCGEDHASRDCPYNKEELLCSYPPCIVKTGHTTKVCHEMMKRCRLSVCGGQRGHRACSHYRQDGGIPYGRDKRAARDLQRIFEEFKVYLTDDEKRIIARYEGRQEDFGTFGTLGWEISNVVAAEQVKRLDSTRDNNGKTEMDRIQGAQGGSQGKNPVPKAGECKRCYTPDHEKGNCPAWGYTCVSVWPAKPLAIHKNLQRGISLDSKQQ